MATIVDLALAWEWTYDRDFIYGLDRTCQQRKLKSYIIYPSNLDETLALMAGGELIIKVLLDRASDVIPRFYDLVHLARKGSFWMINELALLPRAVDKATPIYNDIDVNLQKSPVANADETGSDVSCVSSLNDVSHCSKTAFMTEVSAKRLASRCLRTRSVEVRFSAAGRIRRLPFLVMTTSQPYSFVICAAAFSRAAGSRSRVNMPKNIRHVGRAQGAIPPT